MHELLIIISLYGYFVMIDEGIVAVAATALHALSLAHAWPGPILSMNKCALIHSAAGGVGSMLIQMCRLLGYTTIVAVVGSSNKIQYCKDLGN